MEPINIQGINDYPTVIFDKDKNKFEIAGKSLPEDALDFYTHIIGWIGKYIEDPNPKTVLDLKIHYFNTASSKMILYILQKFAELDKKGYDIVINWYYYEDDEDMLEAGEIYDERINISLNLIPM